MATKTHEAVEEQVVEKHAPRYNLILLDDDQHSYEYVIEMLGSIFGYPEPKAFRIALEVDGTGRAIIFTAHFELVELKREQVHGFGADWRIPTCKGAMSSVIEKVAD